MSAPAFDLAHGQIWYADGNDGFYAVKLALGATASGSPAGTTEAASAVDATTGEAPASVGLPNTSTTGVTQSAIASTMLVPVLVFALELKRRRKTHVA